MRGGRSGIGLSYHTRAELRPEGPPRRWHTLGPRNEVDFRHMQKAPLRQLDPLNRRPSSVGEYPTKGRLSGGPSAWTAASANFPGHSCGAVQVQSALSRICTSSHGYGLPAENLYNKCLIGVTLIEDKNCFRCMRFANSWPIRPQAEGLFAQWLMQCSRRPARGGGR